MTVTQTPRTGQTKWSSGSDPLRRLQLNGDADAAEAKFALDDGLTYTALPGPADILRGRYAMRSSGSGAYTTLYRATTDNGAWLPAMGNTVPAPLTFRPHAAGDQAESDLAATFTHPNLTTPPGKISYDGHAQFSRFTAYDADDSSAGTAYVGLAPTTAPDVATLGRMHLRSRVSGEKLLVLQSHDPAAGNMLTAREFGGSDVVTIDASGYLRARSLVGLGGGAINAGAAVVVAPTSASADGVNIGLLVHGQSGAPAKAILAVRRDLGDTVPVVQVDRDAITLGRLPWGSGSTGGVITQSGRQVNVRALGYDVDTTLWKLTRASTSTPDNPATDDIVSVFTRTAGSIRVPLTVSQALNTGAAALVVQRYTDFNGRFMEFQRVTGGTEIVAALEADGRLSSGARWRGDGTIRDVRQQVNHVTSLDNILTLNPGDTYTYTWPAMQLRSVTATDLKITGRVEAQAETGAFSDKEDGQQWLLSFFISVNGGPFNGITSALMGGPAHHAGTRRPIVVQEGFCWQQNIPAGATIQMRTQVTVLGGAVPQVTHRRQWMFVDECIIQDYLSIP